jgi:hypothetical protein
MVQFSESVDGERQPDGDLAERAFRYGVLPAALNE